MVLPFKLLLQRSGSPAFCNNDIAQELALTWFKIFLNIIGHLQVEVTAVLNFHWLNIGSLPENPDNWNPITFLTSGR
jgi:hypothetical protein